jgi:hypothetical protein
LKPAGLVPAGGANMKKVFIATLLLIATLALYSEEAEKPIEWTFTGELNFEPSVLDGDPTIYDNLQTSLSYQYKFFYTLVDFSLRNDKRYSPSEKYWLGHYFYLNEGGMIFDFDLINLKLGRFLQRDIVESPYSLAISSQDLNREFWRPGLPALQADFTFETRAFIFESRWFKLNWNSSVSAPEFPSGTYPDRGANYKVYALKLGDMRFGFQDSTVYVDRVFDPEYFFSPIPSVGHQLFRDSGKPWSEESNDNSLISWFYDWNTRDFYLYAQWLLDDINLDFLIPAFMRDEWGYKQIPQKTAWSLGGYYDFSFGRLGFYHAGATKYTFAATDNDLNLPYQYTYYPDVTYTTTSYHVTPGVTLPIDYMDNYIGYKYGENNIAFLVDYSNTFGPVEFGSSLEYVISGSKSPANPWHEYTTVGDTGRDTKLLDDPVLEHMIAAQIRALWTWRNFTFYSQLRIGGVFNELALDPLPVTYTGLQIYRPQEGSNRLIYQVKIGATYRLNFGH